MSYIQVLSHSLQQKNWKSIQKHMLPSSLPSHLVNQVRISEELEINIPSNLKFSIEGLDWPNKFFSECLINLLALKKGLNDGLSFSIKMGLFAKLFNSLSRPDVLGKFSNKR